MTEREQLLITLLYLYEQESQALRSVLSEWEENKNHFTQWLKAEDLRRVIEGLEHKK